jgi:hypothetical protein
MVAIRRPARRANVLRDQVSDEALSATILVSKQEHWLAGLLWPFSRNQFFFKLRCWRMGQPRR